MVRVKTFAPVIFVLLWSTGFIGAKYILPYAEPFVFLTIRYFFATLVLVLIAKALKEPLRISKAAIKQSMIVALFLHVIYIGGVFYAIFIDIPAGITAVIQPGGSIKDELSIDYCNAHNMAMVFTGNRHFKH